MAKKATTGGPTRRSRTAEQEERRVYLSRAEREARFQRWVLLGIGAAIGVILLVLVIGVVYEGLIFPNQPVAVVNGEAISTADFQARVRFVRWQTGQQLAQIIAFYGTDVLSNTSHPLYQQVAAIYQQLAPGGETIIGQQVLNEMIEDALLRQQAAERGITVSPEQVEARVQEFFGYDANPQTPTPTLEPTLTPTPIVSPTPSPTPTETPTPEATPEESPTPTPVPLDTPTPTPTLTADEERQLYQENSDSYFAAAIEASGLTRDQLMAIFEVQVLREDLLYDAVTGDLPRIEEQVDARHILVDTEQEAEDVMAALAEGESFTDLARYTSSDTGSGLNGGELNWRGRDSLQFGDAFADAAFNAEIGAIVGPVEADQGFHIIQVHAREERELTDSEYDSRRSSAFLEWIDSLRADEATTIEVFDIGDRTPSDPSLLEMGLMPTG